MAHGFRDFSPWTAMLALLLLCLSKQKCHSGRAELLALQLPGIREGRRGLEQDVVPENRPLPIPLGPISRHLKHLPKGHHNKNP